MDSSTFIQDVNISKEEVTTVVQLTRNLPNILRNSNARTHKNCKALTSNKDGTSNSEDVNISIDLNVTSSSVDSDKESKYNKIASPKSHRQRKQVHNPLDTQYDVPDWNNNNKSKVLADCQDELYVSLRHEEDILPKKSKLNNKHKSGGRKRLFNKKSKQALLTDKAGNKTKEPDEKLNSELTVASDRNIIINDTAEQNVNNPFDDDIQAIFESNISSYMNDLYDIGTNSDEFSNVCYNNNNNNDQEKNCNVNFNTVISGKSTEINTIQHKTFSKDLSHCNTLKTDNNLEDDLINRNITSNFLLASNMLRTCACKNCTLSCDTDVILYEDPVPSYLSSDTEADTFPPSYMYEFCTSDYYNNILGDNWLADFNKKNVHFEEIGNTSVTKENAFTDSVNTKLFDNKYANTSTTVSQDESQISQTSDKIQDICTQSHSNESTKSSKSIEHIKILDETGYLNLESISMGENMSPRNEASADNVIPANVPCVFKAKHQQYEEKAADAYVIQCIQCRRLFNEKHQFRKHFTHCSFYREDFKCYICPRRYRYKSSLVHHLKTVHHILHNSYEKSYTCNKCKKLYVRFRAFQRHLLLHDEDWRDETEMVTAY